MYEQKHHIGCVVLIGNNSKNVVIPLGLWILRGELVSDVFANEKMSILAMDFPLADSAAEIKSSTLFSNDLFQIELDFSFQPRIKLSFFTK